MHNPYFTVALQVNTGVDIESGAPKDLCADGIMDLYATKWWAIKLATDAVITVLKVDQIIMAKQVSICSSSGYESDDHSFVDRDLTGQTRQGSHSTFHVCSAALQAGGPKPRAGDGDDD